MYDSRWPHMTPIDSRPLPGLDIFECADALRQANAVAKRTQTKPFYNAQTGGIFFARGQTPQAGPFEMPFKSVDGFVHKREQHELDTVVNYINLSLVPDREKERWTAQHERRAELERENETKRHLDERQKDAESYATYLSRKRRGVETKVVTL